jgi:hypothetical protein
MHKPSQDEWRLIRTLLPSGWEAAARETKAFRRSRYMTEPDTVLRMLLLHAALDGGLRETVSLARSGGIADISQVALLKRLRTCGDWLSWIAQGLCDRQRLQLATSSPLRLRAVDSTSISGPASTGTDWRVHYAIDLKTLDCDWHQVTDARGGEALARTPMSKGDVMLADRNYLTPAALSAVQDAHADLIVRLRWRHLALHNDQGHEFYALDACRRMRVGQVREWPVVATDDRGHRVPGRVVVMRVSSVIAAQAQRRLERTAQRKRRSTDPKTIEATHFIMIFTTLPSNQATATEILEMYRCRWQIELAFKRLKQLIGLGRLPHRDAKAARTWLLGKLVLALLIERFLANARTLSPWGHSTIAPAA